MKRISKLNTALHAFILSSVFVSCSEEVHRVSDNFVLEGFVTANEPINRVKIKGISPIDATELDNSAIETASIEITNNEDNYSLVYNSNSGYYEYDDPNIAVNSGDELNIQIRVNDRVATASTVVPYVPTGLSLSDNEIIIPEIPLSFQTRSIIRQLFNEARIKLTWNREEGQSYFVVIESRVSIQDDILPEQVPDEAKELLSSFKFVSAPAEFNSFEIIGVALESYGNYVVKVYSVNEEYTELYNNAEQDSRDLNEPPSNVKNALGIFTAFAVDSLEFEVIRP